MTAQEKIQQLAMAALRAAPPAAGVPKPATYMATPEKLRAAIPAAAVAGAGAEAPAAAMDNSAAAPQPMAVPAEPAAAAAEVPVAKHESDPELRTMIEARDEQMQKSLASRSLAVTLAIAAVLVGTGTWIATSPTARGNLAKVVPLFHESVRDVKSLGNLKGNFDEKLKEVAVHQQHIEDATRSMGVDPDSVTAEQEAELDTAMAEMMGGDDARTTSERDRDVRNKLGIVKTFSDAMKEKQKSE